jgi:hypothetical protein
VQQQHLHHPVPCCPVVRSVHHDVHEHLLQAEYGEGSSPTYAGGMRRGDRQMPSSSSWMLSPNRSRCAVLWPIPEQWDRIRAISTCWVGSPAMGGQDRPPATGLGVPRPPAPTVPTPLARTQSRCFCRSTGLWSSRRPRQEWRAIDLGDDPPHPGKGSCFHAPVSVCCEGDVG